MMHNPSPSSDPSRLGTVEDVNGSSISVKLSESTPSGLLFVSGEAYRVGQVGGFVRIPSGYVDLFGIISQVGAGAAPGPPELAPQLGNRWLKVELVGEGRKGTKFERGISQYPSIGDSVHVATESDLKTLYAPGDEDVYSLNVANLPQAPEPAPVPVANEPTLEPKHARKRRTRPDDMPSLFDSNGHGGAE
jgi:hypothetical protein